jgi:hypothetical protein
MLMTQLTFKQNRLLTYNIILAILAVCFGFGGQIGGLFGSVGWLVRKACFML